MLPEAEIGVMGLQNKNYRQHQKLKKAESRLFPLENSRESLPTPRFQISSIQKESISVFFFLSQPVSSSLLSQF